MGQAPDELERGRAAHGRRAWRDAYAALSRADRAAPLGPADLEALATAAYMLGRDDDYVRTAWSARIARHLEAGEPLRAARCAFWLGLSLAAARRDEPRGRLVRPCRAPARARGRATASSAATC